MLNLDCVERQCQLDVLCLNHNSSLFIISHWPSPYFTRGRARLERSLCVHLVQDNIGSRRLDKLKEWVHTLFKTHMDVHEVAAGTFGLLDLLCGLHFNLPVTYSDSYSSCGVRKEMYLFVGLLAYYFCLLGIRISMDVPAVL